MNLADDVNIEEFVMSKEELSGADIKAVCTEAGLLALRERRMKARIRSDPGSDLMHRSADTQHSIPAYF